MKALIFLELISFALSDGPIPFEQMQMIRKINSMKTTWTAGSNYRFDNLFDAKQLLGTFRHSPVLEEREKRTKERFDLPEQFDLRVAYPKCESIKEIRDQANCGSCWAFGAAEAMSDRICIASKQKLQTRVSTTTLVTCCDECGFGCEGGWPIIAFDYWVANGVPTGGAYNDKKTCTPYFLPPCDHHMDGKYGPCPETVETPACEKKCQAGYPKTFKNDLVFGANAYTVTKSENAIMTELYEHGSLEAAFDVYEDFLLYKKGVYQHVTGSYLGGHAVKIIGWGVEKGVKYWIAVNSWNEGWGEKGIFRILKGENECGIESEMVGGEPILPKSYL